MRLRAILAAVAALPLVGCGSHEPRVLPAPPAVVAPARPASSPATAGAPAPPRLELPPTTRSLTPVRVSELPCQHIAVDDASVYWWGTPEHRTDPAGALHVVPRRGGDVADLVLPVHSLGGLAVDAEHLYWTSTGPGRVRAARLRDLAWGGLAADRAAPAEIAVDDTHVYWIDRGEGHAPGAIVRAPKRGGPATPIVTAAHDPGALALDDTHVYFGEALDSGPVLRRVPKGGGAVATLAPGRPLAIAVDEAFVYWSDPEAHALRRVPKTGGAAITLYENPGFAGPRVLALDNTSVFFADDSDGIYRVPKAGGPHVLLAAVADGRGRASALAIDGAALWACTQRGLWQLPFASGGERSTTIWGVAGRDVAGYTRDGRLVSTDARHEVTVHDTATGRPERVLATGERDPSSTAFALSRDGGSVFTREWIQKRNRRDLEWVLRRRDLASGAVAWTTPLEFDGAHLLAVLPARSADRLLVALGDGSRLPPEGTVRLLVVLDAASGRMLRALDATSVQAFAILPDGRTALTATRPEPYSYYYAWNLDTGARAPAFDDPRRRAVAMAVSRDGRRAATVSREGRIAVWDLGQRRSIASFETHAPVQAIALLGAGDRVVVGARTEACLWDVARGQRLSCSGDAGLVMKGPFAISPSEDEVAWPANDFVRVWRLRRPASVGAPAP